MPLTKLDDVAALVVIDLQKGIVGLPIATPAGEIVGQSAQLSRAFRERGLPVVLVNTSRRAPGRTDVGSGFSLSPDGMKLAPELEQQSGDLLLTKEQPGAFLGTRLNEILRERRVTQVFLTGVATSRGVEATARSAYDLGYNVVLVADAMTDLDAETHRYCIEKVFPRLGEVDVAENVLKMVRG